MQVRVFYVRRYSFCVGRNWISFQFRRRKKLNSQTYRRRIAYMIYEGLVAFRSGKTNTLVKDNLVQNIKQNDIKKSGKITALQNKI